ncbi:hypothetical protein PoB_004123300 [Plakobranchus ocellatus]|uniref:Uncharacterized protein n=1 Tax=Plakobranchus ocellatus TaxID=259542 RepID=A0AAV4B7G3_9GAST|nr:hypothetical protein PoB_004123300 [Plakobranchus ocellatus]
MGVRNFGCGVYSQLCWRAVGNHAESTWTSSYRHSDDYGYRSRHRDNTYDDHYYKRRSERDNYDDNYYKRRSVRDDYDDDFHYRSSRKYSPYYRRH